MFKNASVFNFNFKHRLFSEFELEFRKQQYTPIGSSEIVSIGWVPPKSDGNLLHTVSPHLHTMRLAIEKRTIPSSVINRELEKKCVEFFVENGFRMGRVAKKNLKEDVIAELIPRAFPVLKLVNIIINLKTKMLIIDTASSTVVDDVIKYILKATSDVEISSVPFERRPSENFGVWVEEQPPGFYFDDTFTITTSNGKVVFKDTQVITDEVLRQRSVGGVVSSIGMTYEYNTDDIDVAAEHINFVINEGGTFRSIKYPESLKSLFTSKDEEFNGNIILCNDILTKLIGDTYFNLGANKKPIEDDELV